MIQNMQELSQAKEAAAAQLKAYDCRILFAPAPAVSPPVPTRSMKFLKIW